MSTTSSGGGGSTTTTTANISKTNLSHILPAASACQILGEDAVSAVVRSFLRHVAGSAGAGRGLAGSGAGSQSAPNNNNNGGGLGGGGGRPHSSQGSLRSLASASQRSLASEDPRAGLADPAVPFPYRVFSEEAAGSAAPGEAEAAWVDAVVRALFYDFESRRDGISIRGGGIHGDGGVAVGGTAGMGGGEEAVIGMGGAGYGCGEEEVLAVWQRLTRIAPGSGALGLDKASALGLGVLVPYAALPHPGSGGHLALFECVFHALAASPPSGGGNANANAAASAVQNLKSRVEEQMMGGAAPAARARSVLLLPDLIIFFAICRKYRLEATTPQLSKSEGRRYATLLASLLAFRVYDGYQKKGLISRDTVHRFFADVHGEDSYRKPAVRRVLDALFTVEELVAPADGGGGSTTTRQRRERPHLTPAEFCRGVSTTTSLHPATGDQSHVLLDWVLALGNAMLPEAAQLLLRPGPAMRRLLRGKMDLLAAANPDRAVGGLCKKYRLGQGDLYEVKRRFRSVVELVSEPEPGADADGDADGDEGGDGKSNLPLEEDPTAAAAAASAAASAQTAAGGARNVIRKAAFTKAASEPNETDGQGGYLTTALAELTFAGGWIMGNRRRRGDEDDKYWTMIDALSFGCRAVRGDAMDPSGSESGLLKFVYGTFLMLPRGRDNNAKNEEKEEDDEFDYPGASDVVSKDDASSTAEDMSTLDRVQIGYMIELLIEHWAFRLATDSPPEIDDDSSDDGEGDSAGSGGEQDEEEEESSEEEFDSDYSGEEDEEFDPDEDEEGGRRLHKQASEHIVLDESKIKTVDVTAASLLGMLPPNVDSSETTVTGRMKLDLLIDFVLDESLPPSQVGEGDDTERRRPTSLTFPGFLNWYHSMSSSSAHLSKSERRCGPYMLDLRLLGSILFGVRPSQPSMEQDLVEEVQRRHKYRYPHMGKNMRGPPGTVWFVINVVWWRKWLNYCQGKDGITASRLGRIDNNVLLENGSLAMRAGLRWKYDFELIPPLAWSALQAWHDGGPPIHRTVVTYPAPASSLKSPTARNTKADDARALAAALLGNDSAQKKKKERLEDGHHDIELYPLFVTVMLCDAPSGGEPRPFQQQVPLSRQKPIRTLVDELCEDLEVNPMDCRLWMRGKDVATAMVGPDGTPLLEEDAPPPPDFLLYLDMKLEDQLKRKGITLGEGGNVRLTIILELKNEKDGAWPLGRKHNLDIAARAQQLQETGKGLGDGICGLHNQGNSCYLNSSIQCLSHTPILRDYFTSRAYLNDINTENPLGQQGRLAQVTAVLVNELWKRHGQASPLPPIKKIVAPGSYNPVLAPALTPKSFKDAIGKFNEDFKGNEQHDAQELLAFLLAGLSEDLNRVHDKPYIEAPDSDGRPDSELADIWWSNHLKREMSIIIALFTGQYKSLLSCKTCGYESARFEPFSFLTVPLPEDDKVSVQVVFYPLANTEERMKYTVRVKHDGTLFDVMTSLARIIRADSQAASGADNEREKTEEDGADVETKECEKMAKNMSIVRMKESYIFNIVPTNWPLTKMQNRDTGEMDVIHIYELDPVPEVDVVKVERTNDEDSGTAATTETDSTAETSTESTGHGDEADVEGAQGIPAVRTSYLAIAQRKLELGTRPFLHPYAQCSFGIPLLIRVADLEGYTGRDLYDLVAGRVEKYTPKIIHPILHRGTKLASNDGLVHVDEGADGGSPSRGRNPRGRHHRRQTTADMEDASAGKMPRYGFRLRLASRDGRRCAICPWYESCIGCHIPDDDSPTIVSCGDSIAIDWHLALDLKSEGFGWNISEASHTIPGQLSNGSNNILSGVKNHRTCSTGKGKYGNGAITLEECLDAFSKQEKVPDAYCSKCNDLRDQSKEMTLWRLPPVIIIHLKRFQWGELRRKLRDHVEFPTVGLDFSRIIAGAHGENDIESDADGSIEDTKDDAAMNGHGETPAEPTEDNKDVEADAKSDPHSDADNNNTNAKEGAESSASTNDLANQMKSLHVSPGSESLYDLYGVVHHQGTSSTGHYVATLKSESDGKWRLFNDAQIFEVNERDVVDSSAYILFYIRRDVKQASLDDLWDTTVREGQGMSHEEMERMMKEKGEKCVIS